jgi:hypothetical protein
MKSVLAIVIGLMAAGSTSALAADASYVGKWKFNASRSQVTGQTVVIEKTPSGSMRYEAAGFVYTFNVDGKEYPMPDSGTTSWKAIDAKTWDVTNRRNGKISANYRLVVEGDTLTFQSVLSTAGGGNLKESGKATRMSGGPGFIGKWKVSDIKPASTSMNIAPNGADGITLTYPEQGAVCNAKFDGKDYPLTGPFVGTGSSYVLKKTGPRSFEIIEKLNGKALYIDKISVSDDGKTLTLDGSPTKSREPVKVVYDRQ